MSMADLVAAGAPGLPEGWFYRVCSNGFCLEVEVREWRKRFGSRQHSYALVRDHGPDGLENVVRAACQAVSRIEEEDEFWRRRRDAAQFLGDHDPRGGR